MTKDVEFHFESSPTNRPLIVKPLREFFWRRVWHKITNFRVNILGISVHFHWSMLLPLLNLIHGDVAETFIWWGILFASILAHEFGHAFASIRFGYPCKEIVLFVFGGVAKSTGLTAMPPNKRFLTYAAGPAVSMAIFIVAASLYRSGLNLGILETTAIVNLGLLIFNLLPMYPLDGGGMMLSWMLSKNPTFTTYRRVAVISIVTAVVATILIPQAIILTVLIVLLNIGMYKRGHEVSIG